MKQYVIIGNGIAACGCIEGIRSVDKEGAITVISEEKYPVYGRPLISYYLEKHTTIDKMMYRKESFYEDNGCKVLYGEKAVEIDKDAKRVKLASGEELSYDKLCVATGSSPFIPKFEGIETVTDKFSFMTIEDSLALEKVLNPDARVFIVGAGLIGLKCAEGISERVKQITVCDMADRILSSIMDDECASMVQAHLEEKNIQFMLGDSAVKFDGKTAVMKSGKTVEFDVLVLAVGVRANISIVKDAGAEINRAILVNTDMSTTLPDIYAAGDCTESADLSSGTKKVMAILPNAYAEGRCAGINMAGKPEELKNEIPMNSIGFFGYHTMSAGSYYTEETGGKEYIFKGQDCLKKFYTKDGYLTGFVLINATNKAGIYTNMIRSQIPLEEVDFEGVMNDPGLVAFSRSYRDIKLAGK